MGELGAYSVNPDAYSTSLNGGDCDYVRKGAWRNETWQVDPADLADVMPEFLRQRTCFGEDATATISSRYSDEIGWDGAALRYLSVSVESNVLDPFSVTPEVVTKREYNQFIAIRDELEASVSRQCLGNVVMTDLDEKFVFMNNQAIYVRSAVQSSVLGIVIAFAVLLISTRVLHLALFASVSITCVLLSVVGTIESTLIGIIAGFSVDYVVHLAHAYEIASGD